MRKILLLCFCLVITTACNDNNSPIPSQNTNIAKPKPSPQPTLTKEEQDKEEKLKFQEREEAINSFITKNYKGWQLKGFSNELGECELYSNAPCNLLLAKGQLDKVVAVMMKHFTDKEGKTSLVVYEARSIDLSQLKIQEIKDRVTENLTEDDCQGFIDEAIKAERN